uniref:Putative pogo transposable element n=1 Tax=Ixodes ricinus TaxID=34613 RepID=A0A6B0V2F6_IXORI
MPYCRMLVVCTLVCGLATGWSLFIYFVKSTNYRDYLAHREPLLLFYRKIPSKRPHPCKSPPPTSPLISHFRAVPGKRPPPRSAPVSHTALTAPRQHWPVKFSPRIQSNPILLCSPISPVTTRQCRFVLGGVRSAMHSYTVAKENEVVQWHCENGKDVHQTSRHIKLDRIREWDKNFDNLLQSNYGKAKVRRKISNNAPVFSEYVDDALF